MLGVPSLSAGSLCYFLYYFYFFLCEAKFVKSGGPSSFCVQRAMFERNYGSKCYSKCTRVVFFSMNFIFYVFFNSSIGNKGPLRTRRHGNFFRRSCSFVRKIRGTNFRLQRNGLRKGAQRSNTNSSIRGNFCLARVCDLSTTRTIRRVFRRGLIGFYSANRIRSFIFFCGVFMRSSGLIFLHIARYSPGLLTTFFRSFWVMRTTSSLVFYILLLFIMLSIFVSKSTFRVCGGRKGIDQKCAKSAKHLTSKRQSMNFRLLTYLGTRTSCVFMVGIFQGLFLLRFFGLLCLLRLTTSMTVVFSISLCLLACVFQGLQSFFVSKYGRLVIGLQPASRLYGNNSKFRGNAIREFRGTLCLYEAACNYVFRSLSLFLSPTLFFLWFIMYLVVSRTSLPAFFTGAGVYIILTRRRAMLDATYRRSMQLVILLYCRVVSRGTSVYLQTIRGRLFPTFCLRDYVGSHCRTLDNYFLVSKTSIGLSTTRGTLSLFRFRYKVRLTQVSTIVLGDMDVFCSPDILRAQCKVMRLMLGVLQRKTKRSTSMRFVYMGAFQFGGCLVTFFIYGAGCFVLGKQAMA